MRPAMLLMAASLAVCLSAEVRAECPTGVIPGALTARLDRTGVDTLQGVFLGQLPKEVPLPETSYTVFECPDGLFDDTIVDLVGGTVALDFHDAHVSLHEGAVEVDAVLDVATATDLDLELCAMPDTVCHAELSSHGITVHARIEPSVTQCTPHLPITELDIVVSPYATEVLLSSCGLYGDVVEVVYDWFREMILELVTTEVEQRVQESLPLTVEAMTTELIADGVDVYGSHFDVAAEKIEVHWDGITVTAAANITPNHRGSCLPASAVMPTDAKSSPSATLSNAMLSVAASEAFIQRAVGAAWYSGLLCFDSQEYGLDLGALLDAFASDPTLDATVSTPFAPVVRLETDHSITIEAAMLEAQMVLDTAVADPVVINATMSATLSGFAGLDYEQQTLILRLNGASSEGLQITAPEGQILFSEEGLASLVDNIVLPAFADNLGPLALTSNLLIGAPIGVRLNDVGVVDGTHLRADLEVTAVDPSDLVPPFTIVDSLPSDPSPAVVRVGLASVDDTTPNYFMRHAVNVDGVDLDGLVGGSLLELELEDGSHTITIAAVDLNGNADPSPIELQLHVDDQPPVVRIVEGPIGVIFDDQARIVFDAGDDHTAPGDLNMRYTAGMVMSAGDDVVFEDGPLEYGDVIELANLPEDAIVRVTIYAVDEVGNQGSEGVAFAVNVEPNFSCRAAPAGWAALLVLLAIFLRRRRGAGTALG